MRDWLTAVGFALAAILAITAGLGALYGVLVLLFMLPVYLTLAGIFLLMAVILGSILHFEIL